MKKFEFKKISLFSKTFDDELFASLGKQGWQMCGTHLWRLGGGEFYFMREIPDEIKKVETFDHLKLPVEEKKPCDCNAELHWQRWSDLLLDKKHIDVEVQYCSKCEAVHTVNEY